MMKAELELGGSGRARFKITEKPAQLESLGTVGTTGGTGQFFCPSGLCQGQCTWTVLWVPGEQGGFSPGALLVPWGHVYGAQSRCMLLCPASEGSVPLSSLLVVLLVTVTLVPGAGGNWAETRLWACGLFPRPGPSRSLACSRNSSCTAGTGLCSSCPREYQLAGAQFELWHWLPTQWGLTLAHREAFFENGLEHPGVL